MGGRTQAALGSFPGPAPVRGEAGWGLRWLLMTSLGWVWVGWGGTELGVQRSCFLSWRLSLGVGWGGRGPLRRGLMAGSPAEPAASAEVQSAAHRGAAGSRGGGGESSQALPVPCPPWAEWVDLEGSVGQGPDHSLWTASVKMLGEVAPGSEAIFLSGMLAALGGVGAVVGLVPAPSDGWAQLPGLEGPPWALVTRTVPAAV